MRIVADTNILVSATYWRGDSSKIMKMVDEGLITLIMSHEIAEEYNKVIKSDEVAEKVEKKKLAAEITITKVINESVLVEPVDKLCIIKDDASDNKFLECAQEGNADYLVSQDKHLLKLRSYKGIKIVKPEEFLKLKRQPTAYTPGKQARRVL